MTETALANEDDSTSRYLQSVAHESMTWHDPWEVLCRHDPNIASWALADKANILNPKLLPYFAQFREWDHQRKMKLLDNIVKSYEADSRERQTSIQAGAQVRAVQLTEDGLTTRLDRAQSGETERARLSLQGMLESAEITQIGESTRLKYSQDQETARHALNAKTSLDLAKIKYETESAILMNEHEMRKYVANNELEATRCQAEAHVKAIEIAEMLRKDTAIALSDAQLQKAELHYRTKLEEAEILRGIRAQEGRRDIILGYLQAQVELFRLMISRDAVTKESAAIAQKASYEILPPIVKELVDYLGFSGKTRIEVEATTPNGLTTIKVNSHD